MILQRLEAIINDELKINDPACGEHDAAQSALLQGSPAPKREHDVNDFMIPIGDSMIPVHADQRIPGYIGFIKLSRSEMLRLEEIARSDMSDEKKAFHLRWSKWRRSHQATSGWHHRIARMKADRTPDEQSTVLDIITVSDRRPKP